MGHPVYKEIAALAAREDSVAATVSYLAEHLSFLRQREKVLICFPDHSGTSVASLMEQAVLRCGAVPVVWRGDQRWKTLLRLAFSGRVSTVIGAPLIVLGLAKIARANSTPLFVRNVVTAGYPCLDWMIDGIMKGLDCQTWGCFDVHMSNIVVGFSCGRSRGVHLRSDVYGIDIVNDAGISLPDGETGEMVLYPVARPELRLPLREYGRIVTAPCPCGCDKTRIMDLQPGKDTDIELLNLGQTLQSWSSVLDCRLEKGSYGLEMEIIVFPGEKLPELPSCAKRVIRPWDPERDVPFPYLPNGEKF